MAPRPTPVLQRPILTAQQLGLGIERLKKRIAEVQALEPTTLEKWSPKVDALQASIDETLSQLFGYDTVEYKRYRRTVDFAADIPAFGAETSLEQYRGDVAKGRQQVLTMLQQAAQSLKEELAERDAPNDQSVAGAATRSNAVFIVHGHDHPAKTEVARLIERAGLRAVILHEQPNAGRTIIQKFEDHGKSAGFAVVVLTPDDVGGPDKDHLGPRARQNVIGEMFWFAGRLGRDRVCALVKGTIEMPSDFAGVGYTDMDDRGAWKAKLLGELKAAGYEIDWGRALA